MSETLDIDDALFARMERAVLKVEARMRRASAALKGVGIPFAIVGGNAVAAWVGSVDEAAVRNTRDMNVMVRREDFERVRDALVGAGFFYRKAVGIDLFLDEESGKAADAVHFVFAGEMVRPTSPALILTSRRRWRRTASPPLRSFRWYRSSSPRSVTKTGFTFGT